MKKILTLAVFSLLIGSSAISYAQNQNSSPDLDLSTNTSANSSVSPDKNFGLVKSEFMMPGWNTRHYSSSLGFSTSFTGTSTVVYENYFSDSSIAYYFGASKASDSISVSNVGSVTGVSPTTTVNTTTYSGAKNPFTLSIGSAYYKHTFRNNWMLVRMGIFGGADYFTGTSYKTGSHRETTVSTTPNTTSIVDTNFGDVTANRTMVFRLGPTFDTSFYLRWFPQLAIGLQAAILYSTDNKTSTTTNTRSRTYDSISGVDQTPSSDNSTSTQVDSLVGPSLSTFAVAGSTFNLFGNFTIKYVW